MDGEREAEVGGYAVGDVLPAIARVVGTVEPPVVLQEDPLGPRRVRGELVHALAELRVTLSLGKELRPDPDVARLPAPAAVVAAVDTAGGDRHPEAPAVARVEDDR